MLSCLKCLLCVCVRGEADSFMIYIIRFWTESAKRRLSLSSSSCFLMYQMYPYNNRILSNFKGKKQASWYPSLKYFQFTVFCLSLLKPINKRVDTPQSEIFSIRCIISLTFKAEKTASCTNLILKKWSIFNYFSLLYKSMPKIMRCFFAVLILEFYSYTFKGKKTTGLCVFSKIFS